MNISMLVYPDMTPLDLLGPLQAWSLWPGTDIQIVWKNTQPVPTDTGMAVVQFVHRIKSVRGMGYAPGYGSAHLLISGGGVPQADRHSTLSGPAHQRLGPV